MALTRTAQAVAWLLEKPGRSQTEAGTRFGITQTAVSLGLKTWRKQNPHGAPHDARRHQRSKT